MLKPINMKMTLPMLAVMALCLSTTASAQHLVSALINACGYEGENEYFLLKNDLDTSLRVDGQIISLRYGSDPVQLEDFTESYVASGNASFVDSINSRLTGCDFTFLNGGSNDSIAIDQHFMIFYQQPSVIPDFSQWCGKNMGNIIVLFSNDPSWRPDGNFNSHPTSTRFFKLALNKHWKMYSYDSLYTSGRDGDYLIWNNQGGLPVDFGNDNSCSPALQAGFLPIEWVELSSYYDIRSKAVLLDGHIFSTTPLEKITVLKSSDGFQFEPLIEYNNISTHQYHLEFKDQDLPGSLYYYMLEVSSEDDQVRSSVQVVNIPKEELVVYPNPVTNVLYHNSREIVHYEIVSELGLVVEKGKSNGNAIPVDHLRAGTHVIRIHTSQEPFTQLFIKY